MKKRIGNDITFTWHIYRKSGETQTPESFDGKDVEVKLISPLQRPVTIEDVSIDTGVVTFTFRGKHQVTLGNYVAVLQENRGENDMATLDVVNAVTLVPHSYMEEDGDDGDVIEASSVELESTISAGGGGGFVQQQADWAQTDANAVDFIKNKPDLGLYLKKEDEDGHGMSIYSPGGITMFIRNEQGIVESQGTFGAGGWWVTSPQGTFQTSGNTIYRGTLGIDQDSVVWEKTATQQIPAATTSANGLMSAEDKQKITTIEEVIPAQASSSNQLADKNFVNSTVGTNTAYYISDNGQPFTSLAALEAYSGNLTNNDYAFVVGTDAAGNTLYTRYKYNSDTQQWAAEYVLNNSSFTAEQWAAISSGITGTDVQKLSALPTNEELTNSLNGKANQSEMSVAPGTGTNADKTTITLKQGTSATVLTTHQDISGKADTSSLASVATSGSYNDLTDKPTVDDAPTLNSDNLVKSGGVYDAVKDTVKNTRPDLSDRFSVADPNGYIGFEIDKNGNLLSPTIEALKSQVPDNIDKRYNDNIIVADSDGNIAFVIDKNGNILSKSIDDCGKNPFRTKSLYTIGDSLFCSNVWQETCAQALGCLYDANVNTNPEYPTSAGGTNSYMKYMLSTYMRVLNLIKQDVIPNQGKDAIIILGNSNDNIFDFNTNARAYKCDNIIELSELTTENLASVDVSERSLNVAIKLPQVSIGTLLTITQLPVREGDINLNVGWSADGHYDYKIHVVPQATQEETLAYVMERILEYDYGSVFDVKMSDDSVGFTMGGAFYPAVLFTDIGNTGMQVATSQSDNVTYYMLKWLNSDDISEWTNTAKWVDGNASSGWKSSIEELQRHYPLAQIAILNCPKIVIDMTDSSMIRPNGTYNQEAFADAILPVIEGVTKRNKDIADFYQVKFIDVWSELGVSANNVLSFYPASGNVHTNKQGQQRWGELIAGAIKGWIL